MSPTTKELNEAIFAMFSTPQGQVVLNDFQEKLKEPSWMIGEPTENAIYREGTRQTLTWLVQTYNIIKQGQ